MYHGHLYQEYLSPKIIPLTTDINVETSAIENNIAGLSCKFPFHRVVM